MALNRPFAFVKLTTYIFIQNDCRLQMFFSLHLFFGYFLSCFFFFAFHSNSFSYQLLHHTFCEAIHDLIHMVDKCELWCGFDRTCRSPVESGRNATRKSFENHMNLIRIQSNLFDLDRETTNSEQKRER